MRRFFVENISDYAILRGDEFEHFKKVLRGKIGDKIICICGDGKEYLCEVDTIESSFAKARVLEVENSDKDSKVKITVFMGIPKGDKMEFLIEKLSELGVSSILPFESSFTIAKPKNKQERYRKIAIEACKQCGRTTPLNVLECLSFKDMLKLIKNYDVVYFAYEQADGGTFNDAKSYKNIAVIVGAEGGFSEEESKLIVEAGAKTVSLGKRILRCETAPLYAVSVINYLTNN